MKEKLVVQQKVVIDSVSLLQWTSVTPVAERYKKPELLARSCHSTGALRAFETLKSSKLLLAFPT